VVELTRLLTRSRAVREVELDHTNLIRDWLQQVKRPKCLPQYESHAESAHSSTASLAMTQSRSSIILVSRSSTP